MFFKGSHKKSDVYKSLQTVGAVMTKMALGKTISSIDHYAAANAGEALYPTTFLLYTM